jgi:uncharacterized protein YecT (DUF1311 family)
VVAIAALESIFRTAVRELVDSGSPYSDRAGAIVHDMKVEVSALHAFHGRKLSVGEFVAHLVPFKSFEDINTALTTLLGTSFLSAAKRVEDQWEKRVYGRLDARVLRSHGPVFEDVKALISARHQIAHEAPYPPAVTDAEVLRRQLTSTELFAHAISEVVSQTVNPDAPLTQAEMNEAAGKQAHEADDVMQQVYQNGLARTAAADRAALEKSQEAFLEYRKEASSFAGRAVAGGSMRPTFELLEYEQLTHQRTEDLERLLRSWEEAQGTITRPSSP